MRFSDYPSPGFGDLPQLEITILDSPAFAPVGVAEVALVATVPAPTNAICDATGHPIERLPAGGGAA